MKVKTNMKYFVSIQIFLFSCSFIDILLSQLNCKVCVPNLWQTSSFVSNIIFTCCSEIRYQCPHCKSQMLIEVTHEDTRAPVPKGSSGGDNIGDSHDRYSSDSFDLLRVPSPDKVVHLYDKLYCNQCSVYEVTYST